MPNNKHMNTHLTKIIAAATLAAMVLPVVASAQVGGVVNATVRTDVELQGSAGANLGEAATTTALARAAQVVTTQASRVQVVGNLITALATKLQMRLAASTATSSDIAAATAALADLNLQIADAQLQASAAFGHIASATAASSTKANTNAELKKARADMVVARQDLAAARKDIDTVLKVLGVRKDQ